MKKKTYLHYKQDLPAIREEEEDDPEDFNNSHNFDFSVKKSKCVYQDEEEDCNESLSTLPDNSSQVRAINGAQTATLYSYMQYKQTPRIMKPNRSISLTTESKSNHSWLSSHFVLIIAVCLCSVALALLAYSLFVYENFPVAEQIAVAAVSTKKITYQSKQVLSNEVPPFYLAVSALDNPFQHTQKAQVVATFIQSACFLLVPFFCNILFLYRNICHIIQHFRKLSNSENIDRYSSKLHRSLRHSPKARNLSKKRTNKINVLTEEGLQTKNGASENIPLLLLILLMNLTVLAHFQTGWFQWAQSFKLVYCMIFLARVSFDGILRNSTNKCVRGAATLSHLAFCGASLGVIAATGSGALQYT